MQLSRRIAVVEPLPSSLPTATEISVNTPGSAGFGAWLGRAGHGHQPRIVQLEGELVAEGPRSCAASPTTPAPAPSPDARRILEEAGAVDASATGSSTAELPSPTRSSSTSPPRRRSQRSPTSRRSTIRPASASCDSCGRSPPDSPRWPVSTPRSTPHCLLRPPPMPSPPNGARGGPFGASVSTASATGGPVGVRPSSSAPGRRAVLGHGTHRCGCVAVRGRRRPLGGHDDGVHAARRPGHGHAFGKR